VGFRAPAHEGGGTIARSTERALYTGANLHPVAGAGGNEPGGNVSLDEKFADAQVRIKTLTKRPDNMELLDLYALFKQGSAGNVSGKRPGMMDFKGRAKYDAWASKKGTGQEAAKEAYVALVERLMGKYA